VALSECAWDVQLHVHGALACSTLAINVDTTVPIEAVAPRVRCVVVARQHSRRQQHKTLHHGHASPDSSDSSHIRPVSEQCLRACL